MRGDLDELLAACILVDDEAISAERKQGVGRLAFALALEADGRSGRFIADTSELSEQVDVPAELVVGFDWSSRAVRFHRAWSRERVGFSECSVDDADRSVDLLTERFAQRERSPDVVRGEWLAWSGGRSLMVPDVATIAVAQR